MVGVRLGVRVGVGAGVTVMGRVRGGWYRVMVRVRLLDMTTWVTGQDYREGFYGTGSWSGLELESGLGMKLGIPQSGTRRHYHLLLRIPDDGYGKSLVMGMVSR